MTQSYPSSQASSGRSQPAGGSRKPTTSWLGLRPGTLLALVPPEALQRP